MALDTDYLPLELALDATTLVDALELRAQRHPDALAYRHLATGDVDGVVSTLSWNQLRARAASIAAALAGVAPRGSRVLLLFPSGLEFVTAFFGCLGAGMVAVPVPPPRRRGQAADRLQGIVKDCGPAAVLCTADIREFGVEVLPELSTVPWLAVETLPQAGGARAPLASDDLALLQYTSGSTGEPRGVCVTHGNLMANQRMMAHVVRDLTGGIHAVSWLPHFHDMGLIGTLSMPVTTGASITLFSPMDFLRRPSRWLEAMSATRASVSAAPNFAYALAAQKTDAAVKRRLDLSMWRVALSGAEPIRASAVEQFTRAFAECGLAPGAFMATYGLAEATLYASGQPVGTGLRTRKVQRTSLQHGEVRPDDTPRALPLVSCGPPAAGSQVAVVPPDGNRPVREGQVGEILLAGPHIARGYWGQPPFNERLSDGSGPWLRTGDLGFMADGELFITGRIKELVIIRGRNHAPQDIEATVEAAHASVRGGGVAAYAVEKDGEERLALAVELPRDADAEAVSRAIREAVARVHGIEAAEIGFVPPRALPRTTSGKLRRAAVPELLAAGELGQVRHAETAADDGAPGPDLVAWISRWIEQNVGVTGVRPTDSLAGLGLDSLNLAQLAAALEKHLGFEVPPDLLFGATVRRVATLLRHGQKQLGLSKPRALGDLAILDDDIRPLTRRTPAEDAPILLTGATGFLGTFLVEALLRRTRAPIICLVRGADAASGLARVQRSLARFGLTVDSNRLSAIAGDLGRPRFGLDEAAFTQLAQQIGSIVHCGAEVNWTRAFSSLAPVNVQGTAEALRLACLGGGLPVHHVSSIGVFPFGEDARARFSEDEDLGPPDGLLLGYTQSKWAAERLTEQARARGVPVSVYRPGIIVGDSRTGAELAAEDQLFHAFLCGVVKLGTAPAVEKVVDVVPVDHVAEAIAAIIASGNGAGRRFNLVNPTPIRQRALYDLLRSEGYSIKEQAYPRWRQEALAVGPDNPLSRFSVYYRLITEARMARLEAQLATRVPVDNSGARSLLDEAGVTCPPVEDLVRRSVAWYRAQGWMPTPARRVEGVSMRPQGSSQAAEGTLVDATDRSDGRLWNLYEKGKQKQWDGARRLDWSGDVDPENPEDMPDVALPLYGSDVFRRLSKAEKGAARRHYQAWQLSQFMHGEQGALLCAARIVQQAPSIEGRMYAATQVMDESRHLEVFSRLLTEKFQLVYPVTGPLERLLADVIGDRRWDFTCLGMQVLIEGLALAAFGSIRERSRNPLVSRIMAYVMEDEARHFAFGRRLLAPLYAEMSTAEREEREEFVVEASYLLRDRFQATDAWEALGLPAAECAAWVRDSGFHQAWQSELFVRIVPTIREIGLWGPRVQRAYGQMGVLGFAEANVDELSARDEAVAAEVAHA